MSQWPLCHLFHLPACSFCWQHKDARERRLSGKHAAAGRGQTVHRESHHQPPALRRRGTERQDQTGCHSTHDATAFLCRFPGNRLHARDWKVCLCLGAAACSFTHIHDRSLTLVRSSFHCAHTHTHTSLQYLSFPFRHTECKLPLHSH